MTDTHDYDQLFEKAVEHMRAKRPDEAFPLLVKFLKANPESEEGWYLLSYAVQSRAKKIESVQRVLKINPDNEHARARLKRLTAPPKKKKTRLPVWILVVVLLGLGLGLLGVLGWRYGDALLQMMPFGRSGSEVAQATGAPGEVVPTTAAPTMTPQLTSTLTLTPEEEVAPVTSTSTVPTASPTLGPTSTPTSIPTQTHTPPVLDDAVVAQMDRIDEQVAELRELQAVEDVKRSIISEQEVRPLLEEIYLERNSKEIIDDQVIVLSTLGLVEPTYDLYTETLNQIGEGIGGFYIPWTDHLYVLGTAFTGLERYIYAHEYTHALVDQHYALDEIGVYPECLSDTDRCLAITALVEGDATYLMNQWLETYGTEEDLADILAAQYAPLDKAISSSTLPPPYLVRELNFKYGDGYQFVKHFIDKWGWQMINIIYDDMPATTEQILHPQKYQVKEKPKAVIEPPLDAVLGDGWRLLASDRLGELGTEMILAHGANRLAQIDSDVAAEAAAGWGGDRYRVYYRGTTRSSVLVAAWAWDHWREADEFFPAMEQYLNLRYRGQTVDHESGSCWQLLNDHFSCIFKADAETLWIIAPQMEMLDLIRQEYPSFRTNDVQN
jgi:hypothetical protein